MSQPSTQTPSASQQATIELPNCALFGLERHGGKFAVVRVDVQDGKAVSVRRMSEARMIAFAHNELDMMVNEEIVRLGRG